MERIRRPYSGELTPVMRLNRAIESGSGSIKQAMERAEELHDPKLGKKLADIWSLMLEANAMAWKLAQEESANED